MLGRVLLCSTAGLVFGLVCYAPADKILPRLIPAHAPLKLYELSGTVLNGQAGYVEAAGIRGKDLQWSIHASSLIIGRVSADVLLGQDDGVALASDIGTSAEGFVSYSLSGERMGVKDFRASAPISELQKAANVPFLPVAGQAELELQALDIQKLPEQGLLWPQQLDGSIRIQNLQWKLGRPVDLGTVSAQFSNGDDQQVILDINDSQAAKIDLSGQAQVSTDLNYSAQLKIKPKADTPAMLTNQLKALGRTDQQGYYAIKNSGKLPLPQL